jgi:hypothetical protein
MHVSLAVEREQRLLPVDRAIAVAPFELLAEERGDPRPVRNKTALPELSTSHHE